MGISKPIKSLLTRTAVVPANDNQIRQFSGLAEDGFRKRKPLWSDLLVQRLIMGDEDLQDALSLAAEQFANAAKLAEMIAAGKYAWVDSGITENRFLVLEAYEPRQFKSKLVSSNKTISTDMARKAVGDNKGTTVQFLQYLIDNQDAGINFPIVHLASECLCSGGFQCCLYVCRYRNLRRLGLVQLNGKWYKTWRFFSARGCS